MDGHQELLVELEGGGELDQRLPDTVQELSEDWRKVPTVSREVTAPVTGMEGAGGGREAHDGSQLFCMYTLYICEVYKWYTCEIDPCVGTDSYMYLLVIRPST